MTLKLDYKQVQLNYTLVIDEIGSVFDYFLKTNDGPEAKAFILWTKPNCIKGQTVFCVGLA